MYSGCLYVIWLHKIQTNVNINVHKYTTIIVLIRPMVSKRNSVLCVLNFGVNKTKFNNIGNITYSRRKHWKDYIIQLGYIFGGVNISFFRKNGGTGIWHSSESSM